MSDIDLALGLPEPEPSIQTPVHTLKVTLNGDDVEYSIKHPGCEAYDTQAWIIDQDGHDYEAMAYESKSFECAIGWEIQNVGFLDMLGVTSWGPELVHVTEHLEPGLYTLTPWSVTYPSTPNGPEEYDAGVTVERIEDAHGRPVTPDA